MTRPHALKSSRQRRAAALAGTVLIIAALNFVIIGSLTAGGDDAAITSQRVDSLRALLAIESGVALLVGEISGGREVPTGERELPSGQTILIEATGTAPPMQVEITARSGRAERTVRISLD
jgi:hypothetical protein